MSGHLALQKARVCRVDRNWICIARSIEMSVAADDGPDIQTKLRGKIRRGNNTELSAPLGLKAKNRL